MPVVVKSQDGDEELSLESSQLPNLEDLRKSSMPKRKIYKFIENLEMSADSKALLFNMTDIVITVGKVLVPIGRAILSAGIEILKLFPTLAFSVVLAKFLPFLLPAALVKIKITALISKLLPILGTYIDFKNIIEEDSLNKAAKRLSARFFPEGSAVN